MTVFLVILALCALVLVYCVVYPAIKSTFKWYWRDHDMAQRESGWVYLWREIKKEWRRFWCG